MEQSLRRRLCLSQLGVLNIAQLGLKFLAQFKSSGQRMDIYTSIEGSKGTDSMKRLITIGNFDGLHLGHRSLIEELKRQRSGNNEKVSVVTFHPHPSEFFGRDHKYLFMKEDLIEQLELVGVDELFLLEFGEELAELESEVFLSQYLLSLNPKLILVGADFRYGKGRAGNVSLLESWSKKHGIQMEVPEKLELQGEVVSSSRIREYLLSSHLEKANQMLGRAFYVEGEVRAGDGRGRTIGFPTVNIYPDEKKFIVNPGVYATQLIYNGVKYAAITNVGTRPTFTNGSVPISIESHALQALHIDQGTIIRISFLHYLRSERKFSGADELVKQIELDRQEALKFFRME